ncbi:DUF4177 domain-containing protein [Chloroflexota bacterium]
MSEPTRWEYQVMTIGSAWKGLKDEQLQAVLNEMGALGWEVASIHTPSGTSNKATIVVKRPLSISTRRQRSMP